jgi:hypothetical protein
MYCGSEMKNWMIFWGRGERTSQMAGDMISFCTSSSTVLPFASETEVVGALSSYMGIA